MSEQSWKNSWGSAAQSFLAQTERQWGLASEQRNSKPTKELMQTSSDEFCNSPVATTAFFSNIIITKLDFFSKKSDLTHTDPCKRVHNSTRFLLDCFRWQSPNIVNLLRLS